MKREANASLFTQLVKKVLTGFFDCAFPAKHFAMGKMLLRRVAANSISFAATAASKGSRRFSSIPLQLLSESNPLTLGFDSGLKTGKFSSLFCGGLLKHEAGLAPSRSPAALLFFIEAIVFRQSHSCTLSHASLKGFIWAKPNTPADTSQ